MTIIVGIVVAIAPDIKLANEHAAVINGLYNFNLIIKKKIKLKLKIKFFLSFIKSNNNKINNE